MQKFIKSVLIFSLFWSVQFVVLAQEKRSLTVTDIMKFREIKDLKLSEDGQVIAYTEVPDRGDSSGHIKSTNGQRSFEVPLASKPVLSKDGQWAGFLTSVSLLEKETATKEQKKKFKNGAVIINTLSGETMTFTNVKSISFSGDSQYALVHHNQEDTKKDKKKESEAKEEKSSSADDKEKHFLKKEHLGSMATLIALKGNIRTTLKNVQQAKFAKEGSYIAYTTVNKEGTENQITVLNTNNNASTVLDKNELASYPHFSWNESGDTLAFIKGSYTQKQTVREHELHTFKTGKTASQLIKTTQNGWFISHDNKLSWSRDDQRLFFGKKPIKASDDTNNKIETEEDLFNVAKMTSGKELQVWHGDDPRIKPHAAKQYKDDQKHTWLNVLHIKGNKVVSLADSDITRAEPTHHTKALLAASDLPYRKQITWDGFYSDLYYIDLKTGQKKLIHERLTNANSAKLSPSGRYVTYYFDEAIWTYDSKKETTINLTQSLETPFANELHDYPSDAPGYGVAGWLENDAGVLVYDRYDIWLFSKAGKASNLTKGDGRKREAIYRIIQTDPEQDFFGTKQELLLSAYYDKKKNFGFYQLSLDTGELSKLLEADKKYQFVRKAKNNDTILYTQEDMHEFPDVWATNSLFESPQKITNTNPQIDEFLWGSSELVEWRSTGGKPLQGVLIKPANYEEGKRYPVLVYYYRYFSQRLHEFNPMKVNHRPNFPFYHSNGYAVFLPDIKFDVGLPGPSATQALVPGVQKLIDMGVADPDAIGLHGHSWSGYQSAFAITQTDVFKAAVAGAPVANMTSAYSGIRLGSGLSRAFQYEKGQSRIGGSLIDDLNLYIENSPVFFADRINTPLLIQFGDIDDAVPWQQGIELYTIMRRLDKPVIMLQYEGEPHHLKKYPNKVDYTIKMKQFFDHHLKGQAAPKWMTDGVPYTEKEKK